MHTMTIEMPKELNEQQHRESLLNQLNTKPRESSESHCKLVEDMKKLLKSDEVTYNINESGISNRVSEISSSILIKDFCNMLQQSTLTSDFIVPISKMIADNENILSISSIDKDGVYNLMDCITAKVTDLIDEHGCYEDFKDFLGMFVKYKNEAGQKSSIGSGEWASIIFDPIYSASPDGKPDLQNTTTGEFIEVKGRASRLEGTQGYLSPLPGGIYLYDEIEKITGINFGADDLNYFNPNGAGFSNLNAVIAEYSIEKDVMAKLLTDTFLLIWEQFDRDLMYSLISSSFNDLGYVCIKAFKRNLAWAQFDYYQKLKGFSSVHFFNEDTLSFAKISDPDSFVENLHKFKYDLSISFKVAGRNKTSQFTVK